MQRRDIAERTSRLAAQLTIVSASVLFKGYCEGVKLGFGERETERLRKFVWLEEVMIWLWVLWVVGDGEGVPCSTTCFSAFAISFQLAFSLFSQI